MVDRPSPSCRGARKRARPQLRARLERCRLHDQPTAVRPTCRAVRVPIAPLIRNVAGASPRLLARRTAPPGSRNSRPTTDRDARATTRARPFPPALGMLGRPGDGRRQRGHGRVDHHAGAGGRHVRREGNTRGDNDGQPCPERLRYRETKVFVRGGEDEAVGVREHSPFRFAVDATDEPHAAREAQRVGQRLEMRAVPGPRRPQWSARPHAPSSSPPAREATAECS